MELYLASREPKIHQGHPDWWHHHGAKMELDQAALVQNQDIVIIKNNAAQLELSHTTDNPSLWMWEWCLKWRIKYSPREQVIGTIDMDAMTLQSAFRLASAFMTPEESRWLIERYGGDAAHQGAFLRWGNFLNIPGPGTGHDGDPNISVLLDNKIQYFVYRFINRRSLRNP